MHTRIVASLLILALLPISAVAQRGVPDRRAHHSLVYHDASRRVLLSGGSTPMQGGQSFTFYNDLWSFDGSQWTNLGTSGPAMSGAQLAYDSRQGRVVSFGGYDGRYSLGIVRVLNGAVWSIAGAHPALQVVEPGFVYDARRDRFVTFGGSAGRGSASGQTWALTGAIWTKVEGAGPPARQAHVMVYDARRNRIVVFGGMGSGSPGQPPPLMDDTWEFDGTRWTQMQVTGPGARNSAGAAYDAKRGVVVIFGGSGANGFFGDTWSWDGSSWKKLADTGPEPRAMGYLAYHRHRERVVLFGGRKGWPDGDLNDTWEWDGITWRQVR